MRIVRHTGLVAMALALAACASPPPPTPATAVATPQPVAPSRVRLATPQPAEPNRITVTATKRDLPRGNLSDYLRALSSASCLPGVAPQTGRAVAITAAPVPLQTINPARKKVGELTFVAGFHLTSPDKAFGGLSGLDILDNGNLLAVSDVGNLVWIDLAADGITPVRSRIASMIDSAGEPLQANWADAEGLAINGGMALVSFEREHRVLAFDIGKCGAAARGAPIAFGPYGLSLPNAIYDSNITVNENQGAEPLGVTSDWYLFTGLETKTWDLSPLSARPIEADPDFALRVGVEEPEFVGVDVIQGQNSSAYRAFLLHRSFSPEADNAIVLTETDFQRFDDGQPHRVGGELDNRSHQRFIETGWRKLAELNFLFNVDNFEGIAARALPDGRVRLFVISDDELSASRRTLLMVFDLPKPRQ